MDHVILPECAVGKGLSSCWLFVFVWGGFFFVVCLWDKIALQLWRLLWGPSSCWYGVKCNQSPGFRDGSSRSLVSAKYLRVWGYREVPWVGFQILQHQVALEKVFHLPVLLFLQKTSWGQWFRFLGTAMRKSENKGLPQHRTPGSLAKTGIVLQDLLEVSHYPRDRRSSLSF